MTNSKNDKLSMADDAHSYNAEILELKNLKSTEIDFDFSSNLDDKSEYISDDIQSINPLKAFSHHADINLDKLNKAGFITPAFSNSFISNTYRTIKRPVLKNIFGKELPTVKHPNLIMVTSAMPGEGKTFSAINLAMSIAMEKDKHVLLIDADVNKPSHFKIMGVDKMPGLTDVLLGETSDLSEVLCRTNIPSLSLMSSGRPYDYSTELLASDAMAMLLDEMSDRYEDRVVIFDSPPILQTTESSVLAENMGQVIVVVEAEVTPKNVVRKTLEILSNDIVLLLLNKQREKITKGGYGYGYGYGN